MSRLLTYIIEGIKSTLEKWPTADLVLSLIDSSEAIQDIGIRIFNCWQMLEELKVGYAKVFVVLKKYDNYTNTQKIDEIAGKYIEKIH